LESTINLSSEKIDGKDAPSNRSLSYIFELSQKGTVGNICAKTFAVGSPSTSKNGWQYRRMAIRDASMSADLLISEADYKKWEFEPGDFLICEVRAGGLDSKGKPTLFFRRFLGPLESSELMFSLTTKLFEQRIKSSEHMRSSETVYQLSAREARSLLALIRLWIQEGKPQHYTKWCQMHQIVATNLYYLGLVRRTASMSGYYFPTSEALDFFAGKIKFPKRKIFIRDKSGRHSEVPEQTEERSFSEYLNDFADRESALKEYREALMIYEEKLKSTPQSQQDSPEGL
jgi:hypothetical protein